MLVKRRGSGSREENTERGASWPPLLLTLKMGSHLPQRGKPVLAATHPILRPPGQQEYAALRRKREQWRSSWEPGNPGRQWGAQMNATGSLSRWSQMCTRSLQDARSGIGSDGSSQGCQTGLGCLGTMYIAVFCASRRSLPVEGESVVW